MTARVKTAASVLATVAVSAAAFGQSASKEMGERSEPQRLLILNNDTVLRTFLVFKTPVVITADGTLRGGIIPGRKPKPIGEFQSQLPETGWRSLAFDDSAWSQRRAPFEADRGSATGRSPRALHTATKNSQICARVRFVVDDPAKAKDLRLTLEYVGGAAVSVNGQEVARGHLPPGEIKPDTLAEKYPDDLYVEPGNNYLQWVKENPKGFARRYRRLNDVLIPNEVLQKGVNVLAIQIVRAPVNEAATKVKRRHYSGMYRVPGLWAYVGLKNLTMTAVSGSAVRPNVGRPSGVQVWNCLPFETVTAFDYGDPAQPLQPVTITGVHNGVFSGRLIVSSGQTIRGLTVSLSKLVKQDGQVGLPASQVRLRVARPAKYGECWVPSSRFDGLVEDIASTVPVVKLKSPVTNYLGAKFRRENVTSGATVPLWISVRVPKDAEPGLYEGTVSIQANGLEKTTVPVRLTVHAWTLPEPTDFRQKHLDVLSPDSLALHYKVPYWSDRHFELMAKSMRLMGEINARQIMIHLRTEFLGPGNSHQSIVRWIKQPDGSYAHDFSIFDRYLDLVERTIGKPLPIRFNVWGHNRKDANAPDGPVTVLVPKTGELSTVNAPPPGSEASYAFWKPVLDEVRKRLEKRGWFDVASLGHNSYCYAQRATTIDVAKRIWPDGVWSYSAHNGRLGGGFSGTEKGSGMPIYYSEAVWTQGRHSHRGYKALLKPGRDQKIWNSAARNAHRDGSSLRTFLRIPEDMIMRGHDGIGYLSAELFPVPHPTREGRYYRLSIDRGGIAGGTTKALLAPGKDGPIATERYEMVRGGVQLCEAILFLQRALDSGSITGPLAEKVNAGLDERSNAFLKGWETGRIERDNRLFALAAEVAAARVEK